MRKRRVRKRPRVKTAPVIALDPRSPDKAVLRKIGRMVRGGHLVAFPTETVYGIATNAVHPRAMKKLREVKDRPKGQPFTVHISSPAMMKKLGCRPGVVIARLMRSFWPGPLTIIMRSQAGRKVGFRLPDNNIALGLIKEAGVPVVAPSANPKGSKPPTTAEEVISYIGKKISIVIDGGRTARGIESTIVDVTTRPFTIVREGAISRASLRRSAGKTLVA